MQCRRPISAAVMGHYPSSWANARLLGVFEQALSGGSALSPTQHKRQLTVVNAGPCAQPHIETPQGMGRWDLAGVENVPGPRRGFLMAVNFITELARLPGVLNEGICLKPFRDCGYDLG